MAAMTTIGYEEARSLLKANRKCHVYCGIGKAVKTGRLLKREMFERIVRYNGRMAHENVYVVESDSECVDVQDILQGSLNGHAVRRKVEWGR